MIDHIMQLQHEYASAHIAMDALSKARQQRPADTRLAAAIGETYGAMEHLRQQITAAVRETIARLEVSHEIL